MSDDIRFRTPLYTVAEGARMIGASATTLATWTEGSARARRAACQSWAMPWLRSSL